MGKNANSKIIFSFSIIIVVLFVFFVGYLLDDGVKGNVDSPNFTVMGTVEAKEVDVASKVPGKIARLYVEEGQKVKKGDALLDLDKKDLEIKKAQAEAGLKGAKAQLDKAIGGARSQQIEQARAALEQAQAQLDLLETKYNRLYPLYEAEALPEDQLDELKTKLEVARLQKEQAQAQLDLVLEGAQAEDIAALESQYELAQAKLEEVLALIEDSTVTAPCNGTITLVGVEEGEFVNTGMPIISITDYDDAWVKVNVYENQLSKIKIGDAVEIKSSAYPDKVFSGQILTINKNPDFAIKKSTDELNEKDLISYSVKIKLLENEEQLFPGMRVDVTFGSGKINAE